MTPKKKSAQQTAKERLKRLQQEDSVSHPETTASQEIVSPEPKQVAPEPSGYSGMTEPLQNTGSTAPVKDTTSVSPSLSEEQAGTVNVTSAPEWHIPSWQNLQAIAEAEGLASVEAPPPKKTGTLSTNGQTNGESSLGENGVYGAVPAVAMSLEQWRSIESQLVGLRDAMRTSDWQTASSLGDTLLSRIRDVGEQQTLQMKDGQAPPSATHPDPLPELFHFDAFGSCPETQQKARPFLQFFAERYFRVHCEGVENIPATSPIILVANHAGVLPYDALMLQHLVAEKSPSHRRIRPMIEDLFYQAPFLGPFLYRMGCVRGNRDNAQQLLQQGEAIVVFPEGYKGLGKRYAHRYRLRRFGRGGFIKLALQTGVPLLPVAIVGAEELHPVLAKSNLLARALGLPFFPITPTFPWLGPLGLLPFPSRWMIRIGTPVYLPHSAEEANNPILVNRLVEEFRQKLQTMVDILVDERSH